jgi:adenylate cyclase class 2
MPIEIEAKLKVETFKPLIAALAAHGATHISDQIETDSFFDTKDRQLLAADKGLRLRISHDLRTNQKHFLLTHKGPVGHGPLKKREETETTVGNPDVMTRLLQQLGFILWLRYQKRRQSWKLDACKVELDEIPHLGRFVEIEGPTDDAVNNVREKLGLNSLTPIKASYVAMLTAYLQERGQNLTDVPLSAT